MERKMARDSVSAGEIIIEAQGLVWRRGPATPLKGLDFRVEKGQHWAVLGKNGAGKSLFMRILMGYEWPTEGRVDILGLTLGRVDLRRLRRRLGWVSAALEDFIPAGDTVLEVILSGPPATFGLYEEPEAHLAREALALAESYGLGPIARRAFGLLSSGEKQRTLLARAALAKPAILFLDEPMANLDMVGRELFLASLGRLAAGPGGPAVVLTTHNTLEISPFMTHGLLLREGRVAAAGPLDEALAPAALKKTFDVDFEVEKTPQGRWLAWVKPSA